MSDPTRSFNFPLKVAIVLSILGLAIIPLLLQQPDKLKSNYSFSKPLIGSLYVALCVLGSSAVFFPKKCGESFIAGAKSKTSRHADGKPPSRIMRYAGHHPDCEAYSANRINHNKRVLCAACTGLFIGAAICLVGTTIYFFAGFEFVPADTRVLAVGYAGLFAGLAQFKLRGYVKMAANLFFVLGSLITLIIADLTAGSLFVDLYVFGLIVFLLFTRILISDWNNTRTCGRCATCRLG